MLTLKQLRDDRDEAIRRLAKKGIDARPVIERIERLDDRRRAIQSNSTDCSANRTARPSRSAP